KRAGKEYKANIILRNSAGTMEVVKTSVYDKLGAELETLDKQKAKELGIARGVEIKSIGSKGLMSKVRVQEGFVILKANNEKVLSIGDFKKQVDKADKTVKVEGIYPGYEGVYNFILNLEAANK
ncbi:MAG: serine protease, partial [Flavitalea sp.]